LALCQAVRWGISIVISRARPPQADWATAASGLAFPSGHTTTAAVVAVLACFSVTVRRLAPRRLTAIRWLVVAWAVAVGLTRVYLGVHWPTDVLGGWLLALALTFGLWATVGPRLRPVLRSRPE
jgi:undecaprenyl-diphosphatase